MGMTATKLQQQKKKGKRILNDQNENKKNRALKKRNGKMFKRPNPKTTFWILL